MRIMAKGCQPIAFPLGFEAGETGKFDADTSYAAKLLTRLKQRAYREYKLPAKLACLRALRVRAEALGGYSSYAEPLAGVGLAVRVFDPKGALYLNDQDEGCRAVLAANFKTKPTGKDALSMQFPAADLIFLDFNDFTFKRYLAGTYQDPLTRAFDAARQFVVLNDCSMFYFRYGKGSYDVYGRLLGEKINTPGDYFRAIRKYYRERYPAWTLVEAAYFSESSFLLFSRGVRSKRAHRLDSTLIEKVSPVVFSEGLLV